MNARPDTNSVMNGSTFLTMEHEAHRRRRAAVSPFFSKRSIRNIDHLIRDKIEQLMSRFHQDYVDGRIVNLSEATTGLTLDVISAYCFGEGMRALDNPQYGKYYRDMLEFAVTTNPVARQFPTLVNFMTTLPPWLVGYLNPVTVPMLRQAEQLIEIIRTILDGKDERGLENVKHRTIFHEIKDSNLPPSDKTPERLLGEATVLFGAGTETTARTL